MEISPELLRPACQNKFLYVCMYVFEPTAGIEPGVGSNIRFEPAPGSIPAGGPYS